MVDGVDELLLGERAALEKQRKKGSQKGASREVPAGGDGLQEGVTSSTESFFFFKNTSLVPSPFADRLAVSPTRHSTRLALILLLCTTNQALLRAHVPHDVLPRRYLGLPRIRCGSDLLEGKD